MKKLPPIVVSGAYREPGKKHRHVFDERRNYVSPGSLVKISKKISFFPTLKQVGPRLYEETMHHRVRW